MSTPSPGGSPVRHRRRPPVIPVVAAALAAVTAAGVVIVVQSRDSAGTGTSPATALTQQPVGSWATPAPTATATSAPPATRTPSSRPTTSRPPTSAPPRKTGVAGYPGPDDTGVPPGTKLRDVGELTVTKAGTVVDGVRARCIVVRASNVTVRRSLVRGGSCGSARQIEVGGDARGVLIEDVEIDGARVHAQGAGLGGSGFTCRRCDIHGMARGVQPGDNVVVEDSWIHDLYGTGNSENAAFQSNGGSHLVIRRSTLEMNKVPTGGMALALIGDFAPLNDILVEGNLFNGGGSYTIWAGDAAADKDPSLKARNTRFLNNAFGRKYFPRCGYYGPVAGWDAKMPGNRWSGNRWLDNGRPIVP